MRRTQKPPLSRIRAMMLLVMVMTPAFFAMAAEDDAAPVVRINVKAMQSSAAYQHWIPFIVKLGSADINLQATIEGALASNAVGGAEKFVLRDIPKEIGMPQFTVGNVTILKSATINGGLDELVKDLKNTVKADLGGVPGYTQTTIGERELSVFFLPDMKLLVYGSDGLVREMGKALSGDAAGTLAKLGALAPELNAGEIVRVTSSDGKSFSLTNNGDGDLVFKGLIADKGNSINLTGTATANGTMQFSIDGVADGTPFNGTLEMNKDGAITGQATIKNPAAQATVNLKENAQLGTVDPEALAARMVDVYTILEEISKNAKNGNPVVSDAVAQLKVLFTKLNTIVSNAALTGDFDSGMAKGNFELSEDKDQLSIKLSLVSKMPAPPAPVNIMQKGVMGLMADLKSADLSIQMHLTEGLKLDLVWAMHSAGNPQMISGMAQMMLQQKKAQLQQNPALADYAGLFDKLQISTGANGALEIHVDLNPADLKALVELIEKMRGGPGAGAQKPAVAPTF